MLIPIAVDVPMQRWPIANFLLIGVTVLFYLLVPLDAAPSMILTGWSLPGLLGHMLLHIDLEHLLGNMLFLWVFGNAVCAKLGNVVYLLVYTLVGVAAAVVHLALSGHPAVGASGAINGIVGIFLLWYPLNNITCGYFIGIRGGTFEVSSMWIILLWLMFDVWGALSGSGGVAYWAHLGGLASGAGLAYVLLTQNWVQMYDTERSLLDVLADRSAE